MALNNFLLPDGFDAHRLLIDERRDDVRDGVVGLGPGRPPLPIGPSVSRPVDQVPCFRCGSLAGVEGGTYVTNLGEVSLGVRMDQPGQPCSGSGRHRQLSSAWRGRSLRIALIGQIGTGKTTYLTALYDAVFIQGGLDAFGWDVVMPLEWQDVVEAALHGPMFGDLRELPKNPAYQPALWSTMDEQLRYEPFLAFTLVNRHDPDLMVDVTVVDVAGERLSRAMGTRAPHVAVSEAAIFFLNPASLTFTESSSHARLRSDPREADWVQAARGDRANAVPYPVCVVLGKADVLKGKVDDYLLSQPTYPHNGHRGRATYPDLLFDSFLAQDALEFGGAGDYLRKIEDRFETLGGHQGVTYHLLAAAGAEPRDRIDGQPARYPRLAPFRVLDPLLSLLYRKGFMPTEEATDGLVLHAAPGRAPTPSDEVYGPLDGGAELGGYDPGVPGRRGFRLMRAAVQRPRIRPARRDPGI
jgi:hypothetical protein